jgi:thymidylate synthase (FAD)
MKTTNHSTVELIDHMGSDLSVVNAARVSFDKHHDTFENNDNGLIKFLQQGTTTANQISYVDWVKAGLDVGSLNKTLTRTFS